MATTYVVQGGTIDFDAWIFNAGATWEVIDSYERGWRGRYDRLSTSIAAFRTTSDFGDVQSFNNGLILLRTAERINGVEALAWPSVHDGEAWSPPGPREGVNVTICRFDIASPSH
ncbi:hypothetical protein [Brevundimonas faecalis]|uniref:Uncharacterized protein n=1 Tax=Brevundimonas faecalis TaxID=947378 RepID=A0ABV2R9M1_9CAUL